MTSDGELAERVKDDYRTAALDARTRLLLDYAILMTRDVHAVEDATLAALRAAGWRDEDILHATHIAGFFNYFTRLVEALGVEPEEFMGPVPPGYGANRP